MAQMDVERDVQKLAELGYRQELTRAWSSFTNFAISFTIISVLAGCFTNFSFAWGGGGPAAIAWGWPILCGFVLLVAFSMAELTSAFPTAGGPYWWAHRLGFFTQARAMTGDKTIRGQTLENIDPQLAGTPAFAWIVTAANDRAAQLAAGAAYLRANLAATARGLAMQPLSQALQEFPEMLPVRAEHKRMLGVAENRILGPADHILKRAAEAIGKGDTFYRTNVAVFEADEQGVTIATSGEITPRVSPRCMTIMIRNDPITFTPRVPSGKALPKARCTHPPKAYRSAPPTPLPTKTRASRYTVAG